MMHDHHLYGLCPLERSRWNLSSAQARVEKSSHTIKAANAIYETAKVLIEQSMSLRPTDRISNS